MLARKVSLHTRQWAFPGYNDGNVNLLTPLTYSVVPNTCIAAFEYPRVKFSGPYACVIIRVNSGFTYVNALYMRMHGWACRYCKLRSRTGMRARVCMQDSSAGAHFRVIIRALARITALPINTDHGQARTHTWMHSFACLPYITSKKLWQMPRWRNEFNYL